MATSRSSTRTRTTPASYRVPQFVGFLDELKVRAAYGQSGTEPTLRREVHALTPAIAERGPRSVPGALAWRRDHPAGSRDRDRDRLRCDVLQVARAVHLHRVSEAHHGSPSPAGVAPSLGLQPQWFNGGEFTNQGIEFSLTATPVQLRNGFTWNHARRSFYRNYSVVNSLPVPPSSSATTVGGITGAVLGTRPGRSLSEIA